MVGQPDDTPMRVAAIYAAATRFRAALERGGLQLVSLADFPRGSCGDTCELLGQFLMDSGFGEWLYCSGQRDEPFYTHAWLEREGWILDITADQFDEVHEPVLLTQDHSWHARYLPFAGHRIANLDWFLGHDNAVDAQWTYGELRRRVGEEARSR